MVAEPRVSLALEDGKAPVVAEGKAVIHRDRFPPSMIAAFADKYRGWDPSKVLATGGARVLVEIPVTRWLLAGTAQ